MSGLVVVFLNYLSIGFLFCMKCCGMVIVILLETYVVIGFCCGIMICILLEFDFVGGFVCGIVICILLLFAVCCIVFVVLFEISFVCVCVCPCVCVCVCVCGVGVCVCV